MLGPPKCSKHKSLARAAVKAAAKEKCISPPSQEEYGNHGKSFLTICNSSISLPAVHTHMAWYAKSAPTHTGYKSCNEYICPKWQQAGRQAARSSLSRLSALHTSRRGRETFYLAPSQLDKRVSPRLPAARPSSVSVSPDRFPNNFDNFFSLLLPAKKFRGTLTEMIDDSR